jgi:predicted  nucleic acid-binding Zn-ribbon protein
VGSSLQLKTQLKIANDLLIERDATIAKLVDEKDSTVARLTGEIENINNNFSTNQDDAETMKAALLSCQDKLKIAEESHSAISSKVSHMDTLLKQLADMKQEIKNRDDKIASLTSVLVDKDKLISELTKNIEILTAPPPVPVTKAEVAKNVKESSTVKVQLNTKTKTKEPDDDF